jgi:tRNA threonylcarbamoyladenosine biosynthesis protein TsaB
MRILGIDTSTRFLCIGVYDDEGGTGEYRMDLGRRHSTYVLPMLKRILESLNLKLKEFDYFAVGLGPGSFTGIRIGLSIIKGFAYALNKPVVGISSLDMLAFNVKDSRYLQYGLYSDSRGSSAGDIRSAGKITVCPVIDAKRGLVFGSLYRFERSRLKRLMPYKLITIGELLERVPPRSVFLGDALTLYKRKITQGLKTAVVLDEDYWYPRPGNIIELARQKINGKETDNRETLRPIYLYPKECQIKSHRSQVAGHRSEVAGHKLSSA